MIETSTDITKLAIALHKVQGIVTGVEKDSRNPHFKTRYASLASVIEEARPALQANDIAFIQAPGVIVDGALEVTTMLVHVSGQWLRSTVHVPLSKKDPQAVGSATTYGARYSLMAALGMPPVDEKMAPIADDDGEVAMGRGSVTMLPPVKSAPEPDLDALRRSGDEAARHGLAILRTFWTGISPANQKALGGAEQITKWKSIAEKADAGVAA